MNDRRLTDGNSRVLDDDAEKSGVVEFSDARLIFAFSGIAEVGSIFSMAKWLPETLCRAGRDGNAAEDAPCRGVSFKVALDRVAESLTAVFQSFNLKNPRTSVVLVGFAERDGVSHGVLALVSNFEDLHTETTPTHYGSFKVHIEETDVSSISIRQIGSGEIQQSEAVAIAEIAEKPMSPERALSRAVDAVRAAANRDGKGSVGHRCTTLWLPRRGGDVVAHNYYSDCVTYATRHPYYVNAKYDADGAYLIGGGETTGLDRRGNPMASRVPPTGKNRTCPCGSGRKYKRCHGAEGVGTFGPTGAPQVVSSEYFMLVDHPRRPQTLLELFSRR